MISCVLNMLVPMKATLASSPLSVKVAILVGYLTLSRLAMHLLVSLYTFFLRPAKNLKSFGQWGIITGATDGVGKALAMELARKGMNVVLMSRTQSRLEDVRAEIIAKYPKVQVEILAVDFNRVDEPSVREALRKTLEQIKDIGVLYNNVGISYDFPEYFDKLPEDRVDRLIKLNVTATTIMSNLILPGMTQRKRGVIVNISSGSCRIVVPLLSEYSATKKYIEQLTLCLAAEYSAKNVYIQCHVPMFVSTKLAKIRNSSFMVPSPATFARASVAHLGHNTLVSPYWPHALQIWLYERLPAWLQSKVAMTTHLSLRKRALKKLEAKKNE
ncbi:unnamed protein product [Peronospora belbahrii]|uniref:Uncharacterized protein n=1 Tax=Peronospora belbahrii TaxID=622444 RepID=A0AAU9KR67_9STRA|nr:unnamed protein product [Peronospora belbahrii]CAH0520811.1 unnamed protein product [Peronospora belbahrii]